MFCCLVSLQSFLLYLSFLSNISCQKKANIIFFFHHKPYIIISGRREISMSTSHYKPSEVQVRAIFNFHISLNLFFFFNFLSKTMRNSWNLKSCSLKWTWGCKYLSGTDKIIFPNAIKCGCKQGVCFVLIESKELSGIILLCVP